jgi:hypothetical protein
MALPNLTGTNIQDTYQRLLQTDGGTLKDGTGSAVTLSNLTISNTGSFGRVECTTISASTGQFDASTITIGGTSFSEVGEELQLSSSDGYRNLKVGTISFISASGLVYSDITARGFVSALYGFATPSRLWFGESGSTENIRSFYVNPPSYDTPSGIIEINAATRIVANNDFHTSGSLYSQTNITASGDISASGDIYFSNINGGTF